MCCIVLKSFYLCSIKGNKAGKQGFRKAPAITSQPPGDKV